jgi:hypothetical protein
MLYRLMDPSMLSPYLPRLSSISSIHSLKIKVYASVGAASDDNDDDYLTDMMMLIDDDRYIIIVIMTVIITVIISKHYHISSSSSSYLFYSYIVGNKLEGYSRNSLKEELASVMKDKIGRIHNNNNG